MDPHDEREIARGLRAGQASAWHALYSAHAEAIWRLVARLMGPAAADVSDVVQEVFLAAARTAAKFDPERGTLALWLGGIARNHVAMYFRKRRSGVDGLVVSGRWSAEQDEEASNEAVRWLESRETAPPEAAASGELATLVRSTLTELPEDYETILSARYFDGVTVEELAGIENCTAVAIRSRLARAREAFRASFGRLAASLIEGSARGRHAT
jgi:RNA polymerase sigma-70 factor, ECF subfamily